MVSLKSWARIAGLSDSDLGDRFGCSGEHARKLRFFAARPSAQLAARIEVATGGAVRLPDLLSKPSAKKRRPARPAAAEASP